MATQFNVVAFRDDVAGVWVATSDDIPGLVTEAGSFEELVDRIRAVTPELLQCNAHHLKGAVTGNVKINIDHQIDLIEAA